MSTSTAVIGFTLTGKFDLQNTSSGTFTIGPGNYVAFPQEGSSPLAYDIYGAHSDWTAIMPKIGAAFLKVEKDGTVEIS